MAKQKPIELDSAMDAEPPKLSDHRDPSLPVGEQLREAREHAKHSIDDVASALNLSSSVISALEEGRADALPQATYVRGYIRSYARFLERDADPLLAAYREEMGEESANFSELPQGLSDEEFVAPRNTRVWRLLGIGALIATAILAWRWQSFNTEQAGGTLSLPTSPNPQTQAPLDEEVVEIGLEDESSADPLPQDEDVPVTTDSQALTENTLQMSFEATCWVDVRDAEGTRLVFQSVVAGEQIEVSSDLAMTVLLGNADGVQATLNEVPFDIERHRQGVYAKFTIPAINETQP